MEIDSLKVMDKAYSHNMFILKERQRQKHLFFIVKNQYGVRLKFLKTFELYSMTHKEKTLLIKFNSLLPKIKLLKEDFRELCLSSLKIYHTTNFSPNQKILI